MARRQVDGPGRRMTMPCRGCGLSGGSGQSVVRPAVWVCQRGAGHVYPPHPPRLLPSPTPYLTGQVTCPGASGVRSSHQLGPTTLITPGSSSRPITSHPSPPVRTRDCHCSGTQREQELRYWDRSIRHRPSTCQNSPAAVTTTEPVTGPPTTPTHHTATTSNHG